MPTSAPREVNFWLGLILMQIILGLALTGYLLPWDQKGYYATQVSTKILGVTPFIGPQLQELVQGGPKYGHHTLTRFFALHAGILPALLVVFLVAHIWVFRRHGITVPKLDYKPDTSFWPDQVLKDGIACLVVMGGVLTLHWIFGGAELSPPANPAEQYAAARPEWYFMFLFQFLRFEWVEHVTGDPKFGAIYVPGAIMAVFFLMPFIGKWKAGHRFNVAFTWLVMAGALGLTIFAFIVDARDEGFQLAKEEAERDAQRAKELADRPSKIPVEGAITLLKNDPFTQGPRLFAKHCSSCHRYNGHDATGRMVSEVIDEESYFAKPTGADLGSFGNRAWFKILLVDYKKHFAYLKSDGAYKELMLLKKQFETISSSFDELKEDVKDGQPNADQMKQLKSSSEQLIKIGKRLRKDSLSRQLASAEANRGPLAADLAQTQADFAAAAKHLKANDEDEEEAKRKADQLVLDNFAAKADRKKKLLSAQDEEIKKLKGQLKAEHEAFKTAGDTIAVVESQIEAVGEYAEIPDPDSSEMAAWYGDEDALKALQSDANKKDLDALVEYLISLSGRKDIEFDAAKVKRGKDVFGGEWKKGTIAGCNECHMNPNLKGFVVVPDPDAFSYPDLSGLYGEKWLKDFLCNPARNQHYGARNRMPAFAAKMTDRELDLLVKWMIRDYYKTKIEPRKSRLDELEKRLGERPDAKK